MAKVQDKTIIRVAKNRENPYVMVNKTPIHDDRLSWKALGLLVYLLSKPDDWSIMICDLIKQKKDGRDSVYSGLKELETAGYLSRKRERDENGKYKKMEYIVYETPQNLDITEVNPQPENPDMDKPATYGFSVSGKTVSGKSDTTNNDSTKNHFTNNDLTNFDDEREKRGYAPSPFYQENKPLIDQFSDYAKLRGIHQDFVQDIVERLAQANYRLSHYSLGIAVNKTLDGIEAAAVSHVPNYFMTVLDNEVRKEQSTLAKHKSE